MTADTAVDLRDAPDHSPADGLDVAFLPLWVDPHPGDLDAPAAPTRTRRARTIPLTVAAALTAAAVTVLAAVPGVLRWYGLALLGIAATVAAVSLRRRPDNSDVDDIVDWFRTLSESGTWAAGDTDLDPDYGLAVATQQRLLTDAVAAERARIEHLLDRSRPPALPDGRPHPANVLLDRLLTSVRSWPDPAETATTRLRTDLARRVGTH